VWQLRRDSFGDSLSRRRRWQGLTVTFSFEPFVDNLTQFGVDFCFVIAITAWTNNAGTLSDKAFVFVGPFNDFYVASTLVHDFESSIIRFTSRS
jgi:hypothetical protein